MTDWRDEPDAEERGAAPAEDPPRDPRLAAAIRHAESRAAGDPFREARVRALVMARARPALGRLAAGHRRRSWSEWTAGWARTLIPASALAAAAALVVSVAVDRAVGADGGRAAAGRADTAGTASTASMASADAAPVTSDILLAARAADVVDAVVGPANPDSLLVATLRTR